HRRRVAPAQQQIAEQVHQWAALRPFEVAVRSRAPIGSASVRPGLRLPGRWPTPLSVVQALGDRILRTPVRGSAGLRLGTATWRLGAGGPLGYLAGRRPLLTLTLTDFRLRFGTAAPAPAATWP
ncbi:hypothetical protein ACWEOZ_09085, partial [Actinoplanes sp. NPDC004185]